MRLVPLPVVQLGTCFGATVTTSRHEAPASIPDAFRDWGLLVRVFSTG